MSARLYIPYIVGSDKAIPFLYENVARHVDTDRFDVTIYSSVRDGVFADNQVRESYLNLDWRVRTWAKYVAHSLQSHDVLQTGGGPRVHYPIAKLVHARNPGLKHVHTFRIDVDPDGPYPTGLKRKFAEMADVVTAVSEHTASTVEEHFDVTPEVIYNAVDAEQFHPDQPRPALFDDLGVDGPVFTFVGQLVERKRPRDVLEVAEAVPEADFLFVGDGALLSEIQSEASDRENVYASGLLSKDRLPAIYAHSAGLAFPSIREGCPNVVMEAMACGTPVVGYRSTSMPELIKDGKTGFLAEPRDVDGLIEGVRELLDEGTVDERGRAARSYAVENHRPSVIVEQYESLYRTLLE